MKEKVTAIGIAVMMLFSMLITLLAISGLVSASSITNTNFNDGLLDGWGNSVGQDSAAASSAHYESAPYSMDVATNNYTSQPAIPVNPGLTYDLSFWFYFSYASGYVPADNWAMFGLIPGPSFGFTPSGGQFTISLGLDTGSSANFGSFDFNEWHHIYLNMTNAAGNSCDVKIDGIDQGSWNVHQGTSVPWVAYFQVTGLANKFYVDDFNLIPWAPIIHYREFWGPTFLSKPITTGQVGVAYAYQPKVNESSSWWIGGTASNFLSINMNTGKVLGLPMSSGTFSVIIEATSLNGTLPTYQDYNLIISTKFVPPPVPILFTPSEAPCQDVVFVCPLESIQATTTMMGVGWNDNLTSPFPSVVGSINITISDVLYLSGDNSTTVYLNTTNGTSSVHYTTLPSIIQLDGGNYTLNSSANVTWTRVTEWRQDSDFLYAYYASQKLYQTTLTLSNTMSSIWKDVTWYVAFPENVTVDPTTASLYDINNQLQLIEGKDYDVNFGGFRLWWSEFDSQAFRSFTFQVYSFNTSQGIGTAIAYSANYTASAIGSTAYFESMPIWQNTYGRTYQGAVFIELAFINGQQRYIDPSSVQVYDNNAHAYLQPWQFAVNGGMIVVESATVAVGQTQSYSIYFHLDLTTASGFNVNGQSPILGLSWIFLMICICAALGISAWIVNSKVLGYAAVIASAFVVIIYIFSITGAI